MIRIKISMGIIGAIIIMSITGFFILRHETQEVIDNIEKTRSLVNSGKKEEAKEWADILEKDWNKYHTYASVFINNNKISAAELSLSRIGSLIESGSDEINAELDTARSALEWIIESEIPKLTNIF